MNRTYKQKFLISKEIITVREDIIQDTRTLSELESDIQRNKDHLMDEQTLNDLIQTLESERTTMLNEFETIGEFNAVEVSISDLLKQEMYWKIF